jgi:hypothetical protein
VKRFAIYILLGFYVLSQLKPMAVVIEDVLAHTFWKAQHMATVHYENGHYHVHMALNDISKEEQHTPQQKAPSSQKTTENTPHHIAHIDINFQMNGSVIRAAISKTEKIDPGFTGINLPPPKTA